MKVNITYKHDDLEYKVKGIKNDNIITFNNDSESIKVEILKDEVKIKKEKKDSNIDMIFDRNNITDCIYSVEELGMVNLTIETDSLIINDDNMLIHYTILESSDTHTYELRWENDN